MQIERNPRVERIGVESADLPAGDFQRSQSDTERRLQRARLRKARKVATKPARRRPSVLNCAFRDSLLGNNDRCHVQARIGVDTGRIERDVNIHAVVVDLGYEIRLDHSPAAAIRRFQIEESWLRKAGHKNEFTSPSTFLPLPTYIAPH